MAFDLSRPPMGMSPGAMGGPTGSKLASRPPGFQGSMNRAERRQQQQKEIDAFKNQLQKVDRTKGTLFQEPAPMFNPNTGRYERTTLAQKQMDLANKYGPTFSELMSDFGRAAGDIVQGITRLPNKAIEVYKEISPASKVVQGIEAFFKGPSQLEAERLRSIPRDDTMTDQQKTDTQLSSVGASPDFLAAINDPLTMAREFNLENLLNQARALENLGNTNFGKFGIEGFTNPTFTFDKPIGQGNLFFKANPSKNLYDLGYTMTFANGGVANL